MYESAFSDHVEAVERLAAAGIPAPKEWTDLLNRYQTFTALTSDAQRRLTEAVLDGNTDEVDELRAFALIEAASNAEHRATVNNFVGAAVATRLTNLYEPSAEKSFVKAAALFNAAAKRFTGFADLVDPNLDAELVIDLDDKQRQAWGQAPVAVRDLDAALAVLAEAAWLSGVSGVSTGETLIALAMDTTDVDRRSIWEAWETVEGRCGRWAAVHALGLEIAAANLDGFQPYRRPAPLQESWERVDGEIGFTRRMVDPEKVEEIAG
jgi:hypothetical protein